MKKAMKWVKVLAILAVAGYGLWMFGEKWETDRYKDKLSPDEIKEELDKTEDGSTYVYSEEEIAVFKKEAQKVLDHDIKEFDIQYGENRIIKLQDEAASQIYQEMLEENYEYYSKLLEEDAENTRLNPYYTSSDLSNAAYATYASTSPAETIFNEDLSLIKPYVFYGYTSVNNPSTAFMKENKAFLSRFNSFVSVLKVFDEEFKDSSSKEAEQLLIDNDEYFIKSQTNPGIRTDALYTLYHQWLSEEKENSMNSIQRYLRVEKLFKVDERIGFIIPGGREKLIKASTVKYDPLPSKYNYWEVDEPEYFTLFWPSSVTKVDDYTYIVDIDTEKPVDAYAATIIAQYIQCRFTKATDKLYTGNDYLKIIIRIDDEIYHDMNSGIVSVDVLNAQTLTKKNGDRFYGYSENTRLPEWQAWSPSKEVRPWVDAYFSAAAKAYEEDSRFSIFETIEQVAEEFNAEYEDVENVIMSCYWTFNGYNVNFYAGK